jgi:hypothetical protein
LFYGALSVHAAVYLLIRTAPIFAEAPIARAALVGVGLSTAVYGTLVGRVQSDAKNALAYATMTQVGIMFAEVGLGLHTLAMLHLVGHACVRTLQLLRAPSALHEAHILHSGLGEHPRTGAHFERLVPERLRHALYRHAIDGFHLDAAVTRFIAAPVMRLAVRVDGFGRWLHGVVIGIAFVRESRELLPSASPAGGRLTKTDP